MAKRLRLTLTKIADRIDGYLHKLEKVPHLFPHHPDTVPHPLDEPYAVRRGNRIQVRYLSECRPWDLTREEAECYLRWLRAGNVGKHWNAIRAAEKKAA